MAPESYELKNELVARLADRYDYDPWRVWIFDMQRASLRLPNPPRDLLPPDLSSCYRFATLVLQGNGFTFTTSETSSSGDAHRPDRNALPPLGGTLREREERRHPHL
jgi:hypothetical protein